MVAYRKVRDINYVKLSASCFTFLELFPHTHTLYLVFMGVYAYFIPQRNDLFSQKNIMRVLAFNLISTKNICDSLFYGH
jgi:hypothetical protein